MKLISDIHLFKLLSLEQFRLMILKSKLDVISSHLTVFSVEIDPECQKMVLERSPNRQSHHLIPLGGLYVQTGHRMALDKNQNHQLRQWIGLLSPLEQFVQQLSGEG